MDLATPIGFRATGGLVFSPGDIEATGELLGSVDIGNAFYTAAEIGTLTGAVVNRDLAPYLGIGWGRPATARLGFCLDLVAASHGTPTVELGADGPLADTPALQSNLLAEQASIEGDISWFTAYPVVSIAFPIRL